MRRRIGLGEVGLRHRGPLVVLFSFASHLLTVLASLLSCPAHAVDTEAIVQRNEQAVVIILGAKAGSDAPVQSSGCFVHPDGLILTTAHQVKGITQLRVKYRDGAEHGLSIVALHEDRELALLKSAAPALQTAQIGDAAALRSGSPLVSIATPVNLDFTTVPGIVSATNRTYRGYPVVQTNLPASPGSSGGPVFDRDGALVGLIIGKLRDEDWVTVINPVNNAYDMLREYGVPVPVAALAVAPESDTAIIPAADATAKEIDAIEAYNLGVDTSSASRKIECYGEAVRALPRFYEAWFNLAVAYSGANRPADAVNAYEMAEKLKPEAVEVQRNLGRVYLAMGQPEAAAQCFERALELTPDKASAYNDAGEAYRRLEQYDKAEERFREAVRLDPGYASAQYNLALMCAAQGRNGEAAEHFEAYLRLAPDAADRAEVEGWIQKLQGQQP